MSAPPMSGLFAERGGAGCGDGMIILDGAAAHADGAHHLASCVLERDAAWEYAISLTPKNAAIYQGLGGGEQRMIQLVSADVSGNTFSVTVPRKILRGEPRQWRLSVALGGARAGQRDEAPSPIPVSATASQDAFGGAPGPRTPPRYIDLLTPSGDIQTARFKSYASGTVILPFVEAN